MSFKKFSLIILTIALVGYKLTGLFEKPPLPKLNNQWWGPGDKSKENTAIRPYKIEFPDEVRT